MRIPGLKSGSLTCAGLLLIVSNLAGACATVRPNAVYTRFGEADPAADEAVAERFEEKSSDLDYSPENVRVFVDTVPEGLLFENGQLSVKQGYEHELLGKFQLVTPVKRHSPQDVVSLMAIWFWPYDTGWRKGLCYPQVPLVWLTLFLWQIVPTAYPCVITLDRPKPLWLRDARILVESVGGDAAIVSYIDVDQKHALGLSGFVLRLDPRVIENGNIKTTPMPRPGKASDSNTQHVKIEPSGDGSPGDHLAKDGTPGSPGAISPTTLLMP